MVSLSLRNLFDTFLESLTLNLSLIFVGMDHGHVVSATVAGLVLKASSNQVSRRHLQQYKNAVSFCSLIKEPMVDGEKISLLVTIKTMRLMECTVMVMMEVVL
jgi:hypothetical protein